MLYQFLSLSCKHQKRTVYQNPNVDGGLRDPHLATDMDIKTRQSIII